MLGAFDKPYHAKKGKLQKEEDTGVFGNYALVDHRATNPDAVFWPSSHYNVSTTACLYLIVK